MKCSAGSKCSVSVSRFIVLGASITRLPLPFYVSLLLLVLPCVCKYKDKDSVTVFAEPVPPPFGFFSSVHGL